MHSQRNIKVRPIIFLPDAPHIALVELTKDQFSVIDASDAQEVGKYNWSSHWAKSTRSYYAQTSIPLSGGKSSTISLHQFLLGKVDGHTPDHIVPGTTLDNRRKNLRQANRTLQNTNQRIRRDNTSGHKNVRRVRNKWRVVGQREKKQIHVGYFDNLQEAIEASIVFGGCYE